MISKLKTSKTQEKKVPNFQDLFSIDDILLADKVRRTLEPGFSRIALCAPDQRYDVRASLFPASDSVRLCCLTLRLKYAMDVWSKAVLVSRNDPGSLIYYWQLHWAEDGTPFKHLEYSDFQKYATVEGLMEGFWSLLRRIANSGEIWVTEGLHLETHVDGPGYLAVPFFSCEIVLDDESGKRVYEKMHYDYPFDMTKRSFVWDEIKDMFVELNLDQLRLVFGAKMHRCSSVDDSLFDACIRHDIEGVRYAIEQGANVNALDISGKSPLAEAIAFASGLFIDIEKADSYSKDEIRQLKEKGHDLAMSIAKILLDHGADVDLFGFDGLQPLVEAYYDSNVEMVRFLLEHGSNPNYNSYLSDNWHDPELFQICSTVLECINNEPDDLTPEQIAIERLVLEHGGHLCINEKH